MRLIIVSHKGETFRIYLHIAGMEIVVTASEVENLQYR